MSTTQQNQIFVGNLSFQTEVDDLKEHFKHIGSVVDVKIPTDRETGRKRGFAFLSFDSQSDAQSALKMDGQELDGRPLRVNLAQGKKDRR